MRHADVVAYCLAKPGAVPDTPWEEDLVAKVGGKRSGRVTEVGIHALRPRPHPRAGDEPPRIGGRAVAGEQGVVDAREHPRVPDDVRARPDRADRLVHPHHPEGPD